MQYLIAYTANRTGLVDGEWVTNGAGLQVSHKFGFGAIDAEAIVTRGRHWENVPVQQSQDIVPLKTSEIIPFGRNFSKNFTVESDIVFLEHVVLQFSLSFVDISKQCVPGYMLAFVKGEDITWPQMGRVELNLTSPSGTTTTLLPQHLAGVLPEPLDAWPLMSVHFWGENPSGIWTITVFFNDTVGRIEVAVPKVTLYGSSKVPEAVSLIPEECSPECNQTLGCAASGPEFCYACRDEYLRVASTRECVSSCPEGLTKYNGYCYNKDEPEESCSAEKPRSAVHDLKVKG